MVVVERQELVLQDQTVAIAFLVPLHRLAAAVEVLKGQTALREVLAAVVAALLPGLVVQGQLEETMVELA